MKYTKFSLLLILLAMLAGCNEPGQNDGAEDEAQMEAAGPDYDLFDRRVEVLRALFEAHENENIEKLGSMLSDSFQWSPPIYNEGQLLGSEEYLAALKGYHDDYENISYTEGIVMDGERVGGFWSGSVFPKETATESSDVIRAYGTWTATHSATGQDIGLKWFALASVNEDGKLVQMNEYWDLGGLPSVSETEE